MKRILLSIVASLGIFSLATAQVEVYINGGTTNYEGGVYNVTSEEGVLVAPILYFKNVSGASETWDVTRTRINEIASWHDYLCWGHENDIFGGSCYTAANMPTNPWTSPSSFAVNNNESGKVTVDILADHSNPGTVTYRYSVGPVGGQPSGFVDVVVTASNAGLDESPNFEISIAPNPATDIIQIEASGSNDASYTIVDVLGNIIKKETLTNSKETIDVRKFKNGIYFIKIENAGSKTITRKIIVRH